MAAAAARCLFAACHLRGTLVMSWTSGGHAATNRTEDRQAGAFAGGKRRGYSQKTSDFRQRTSGPRQVANGQYQISPGDRNLGRREIRPDQSKPVSAGLARQNRTGMGPNSTYGEQSPRSGWSHYRPSNNNNKNYNNKNLESQSSTVKPPKTTPERRLHIEERGRPAKLPRAF